MSENVEVVADTTGGAGARASHRPGPDGLRTERQRGWPRWLPGKWLAVGLLLLFFWAYEAFDLWSSPWLTAWVVLAYFVVAFIVDGFFKGAAFCKHVCPIGQFNFVNGLASPTEVAVRDPSTCASCTTKDCISGRHDATGRLTQSGCELWLFQERKVGNMDCTFCLDCVHACPYDNVGVLVRNPIRELTIDPRRSGVGRFGERTDLAALALLVVFAAFMNAFGMVTPVYRLESWLARQLGVTSEQPVLLILFALGLLLMPVVLVGGAAWLSGWLSHSSDPVLRVATRYSFALVPLGFGMWLAHYGFHFLTGALTIVPLTQSFLADFGVGFLGSPRWDLAELVPGSWLGWIQAFFLELGLLGSLWVARRIAADRHRNRRHARRAFLPWAVLYLFLFAFGIWLILQPMEMRGTLMGMGG